MTLCDWFRRRRRRLGSGTGSPGSTPSDAYTAPTLLHTVLATNTLPRHDVTSQAIGVGQIGAAYGPHHTPHDSGTITSHADSSSHTDTSGSTSSYDSGSSSYDAGSNSGGFDSGAGGR